MSSVAKFMMQEKNSDKLESPRSLDQLVHLKEQKKAWQRILPNRRECLLLERETGELNFTNNRMKTKKQKQRVAKNLRKIPPKG